MLSGTWLGARVAATPDAAALECGDARHSWADLAERVEAAARRLAVHGRARGSLVALQLEPGEAFVCWLHAAWACGARVLPLNTRLTAAEAAAQRALVGAADPIAGAALPDAPFGTARAQPGDALLLFTSGTSAHPKAVRLTFDNLRASAEASASHGATRSDDRWLACLPFFHVGGLSILARSVLGGAAVVVHERFDAARVDRTLEHAGITHVSLVPTTLKRLLDLRAGRSAPTTLRSVLLGGAAAPRELVDRARDLGFPVVATYGMTECASQIATARPEAPSRLLPLPGIDVRIATVDGRTAPTGCAGEIQVRGRVVSPGYEGGSTPEAADGWFATGDVGCLHADGGLAVHDRRGDLIVTGGENVAPAEVEAALLAHEAVDEVAVAGLPDDDLGQRIAAWVVVRPGLTADAGLLQAYLRSRLAGYKIPRSFTFTSALPRNAMGKVVRRTLADAGP